MKIKLLLLVAALAAGFTLNVHATAPTPPAQATAVGFTNLVFNDDFTNAATFTSSTSATSGFNWYMYSWGPLTGSNVTINTGAGTGALAGATGIATLSGGTGIQTVPVYPANSNVTPGCYQHAYFEARIQFSPTAIPSTVWPAFWSFGISAFGSSSANYTSECDFLEAYPNGSSIYATNTLHNWLHSSSAAAGTDTFNTNNNNDMASLVGSTQSAQPNDGAWHIYGCLWVQTSATAGYIEYYYDNHLVVHQGGVTRFLTGTGQSLAAGVISNGVMGTALTNQEVDHMYLILNGSAGWPENVDWVHIWQSGTGTTTTPTTTPQTVSNFPSTLSLTTASSPYTLPATTSAGLTLSYSVTGPATVSGNKLTLTGTGTVVVQASQAGNATYSPFSGTETITVTTTTTTLTPQTVANFPSTLSLTTAASPYTLPATTSAGLTLSYSVTGPATVSGNKLTLTGAGTVVVQASQAGNATYSPFSGTETITVTTTATTLTPQTVADFPSTLSLSTAQSPYTLPATTSAGLTITYTVVSGPASMLGNTLRITAGTAVVQASQAGNATYAPFSATETVTATPPSTTTTTTPQTVSNFPSTLSLSTNQSPYTLPATTSAGLTITYSVTSGPASVSGNKLTLTGAGTVVVHASQAGNATYTAFSATETITVTAPSATTVQTVSNFPSTLSLSANLSPYTLPATTSAGLTITYSVTSGPATVSGDILTVSGTGTVVVHASQAGNATYTAFSATETITVTAATSMTFSQWEAQSGYFTAAELANPAISGPTADPEDDGVPNLLKYLYDINPTTPMSAADYAAMPVTDVDTTTTPGTTYITLTYRQYALETGITINVQTSPDLQTWTTVTPNINHKISTDPITGDPIMEVEVNTNAATREFIRLYVTAP